MAKISSQGDCVCVLLSDGSLRLFEHPPLEARQVLDMYPDHDLVPHTTTDSQLAKRSIHPEQLLWPDLTYQLIRRQTFIYRGLKSPQPTGLNTPPLSRSSTGPRSLIAATPNTPSLSRTSTGLSSPVSTAASAFSMRSPLSPAMSAHSFRSNAYDTGLDFQATVIQEHMEGSFDLPQWVPPPPDHSQRAQQSRDFPAGTSSSPSSSALSQAIYGAPDNTLVPEPMLHLPRFSADAGMRRQSLAGTTAAEGDAQIALMTAYHQLQQQQQLEMSDAQAALAKGTVASETHIPTAASWRRSLAGMVNVEQEVMAARQQARKHGEMDTSAAKVLLGFNARNRLISGQGPRASSAADSSSSSSSGKKSGMKVFQGFHSSSTLRLDSAALDRQGSLGTAGLFLLDAADLSSMPPTPGFLKDATKLKNSGSDGFVDTPRRKTCHVRRCSGDLVEPTSEDAEGSPVFFMAPLSRKAQHTRRPSQDMRLFLQESKGTQATTNSISQNHRRSIADLPRPSFRLPPIPGQKAIAVPCSVEVQGCQRNSHRGSNEGKAGVPCRVNGEEAEWESYLNAVPHPGKQTAGGANEGMMNEKGRGRKSMSGEGGPKGKGVRGVFRQLSSFGRRISMEVSGRGGAERLGGEAA